jgi:hypothetical protein
VIRTLATSKHASAGDRTLELLASSRDGSTKALMRAHGFRIERLNPAPTAASVRWLVHDRENMIEAVVNQPIRRQP